MFDYLIEDNNLQQVFKENDIQEEDLVFIKELIYGGTIKIYFSMQLKSNLYIF